MPSRHGREPAHSLIEEVRNTLQERIAHRSKYYGILATLVRCKLKDRVPPSRNDEDFRYDYFVEQRFPDSRGKKIDRATPPPYPYGLCEEECETCFTQYFPVRISVTDAEALSGVQALTNSINADLDFLRDALTRHADLFVTRWKKKSKAKRAEFLSRFTSQDTEDAHKPSLNGLYPNKWAAIHMINARVRPYMTRPDIRMLLRTAGENGLSESDEEFIGEPQVEEFMQKIARGMLLEIHKEVHHTTWLLPYLDVESLAEEPLLFLSLLYNRTVYDPEQWMMFDNSQLKLAENWEILIPEFNRHCVLMQGPKYGAELLEWDQHRCHRWEVVGYQKAQHILSTQQQMMRFLRFAVQGLLEETHALKSKCEDSGSIITAELAGHLEDTHLANTEVGHHVERASSPKWDQLIQNKFFSFGNTSAQSVRASANQPFSAPPHFDPLATVELVESMYHESVDELELAQTEPSYLQCLVSGLAATAYFERVDSKSRWTWFVDEIVCNLYGRYIWWRQMLKECRLMMEAYERYQQAPSSENRAEYERAIYGVDNIAVEHMAQQILLVHYSLPFQRGFERNYKWRQTTGPDGSKQPLLDEKDTFDNDKLFWTLRCLGLDENRSFTMDPSFHFRVLDDYLSHATLKERSRITEQILRQVSEIAVVHEIRTAIQCNRGWDRKFNREGIQPQIRTDFVKSYAQGLGFPEVIDQGGLPGHLRTFHERHPWPRGKIDSSWLERASASRKHLDHLWVAFRTALKNQQQRKEFPQHFIDEDWEALSAAARSEHLQVIEDERNLVLGMIARQARAAAEKKKVSATAIPAPAFIGNETPDKFVPPTISEKKKTRRTETEFDNAPAVLDAPATPSESQSRTPSVAVKPENLSLFAAMFPTEKGITRSFSWKHFLQAMVDAGFSVTQGSGSAVSFRNPGGVIVFHQPHPDPTIDPTMLMSMGKRLRKWFGWDREVFIARDPEGSSS